MLTVDSPQTARRALSLTEVVVATALVGLLLVAALDSAGIVFRTRKLNANVLTGPGLAQELLDEILAMPYNDPQNLGGPSGVDAGESASARATFDDVDDYDGLNVLGARTRGNVAIAGYAGWRFQSQVAWAQLANPMATSGSDVGLKRVTVSVISLANKTTTLVGLRSRYGALEQKPGYGTTAVTALSAELQLGAATTPERWGGRPTNHAGDVN